MSTTSIQSNFGSIDARREEGQRQSMASDFERIVSESDAEARPAVDDGLDGLDEQAREAVEHRANVFFDAGVEGARLRLNEELKVADPETRRKRTEEFEHNAEQLRRKAVEDAMAIYEDAIVRRGRHQAIMDQMQGAAGLPDDPRLRQAEVERRSNEGAAAMSAQSGVGTVMDNLEGRLLGARIEPNDVKAEQPAEQPANDETPPAATSASAPQTEAELSDDQRKAREALASGEVGG